LSLSEQGQWRLHPDGKAWHAGPNGTLPAGESIESPQIRQFINNNYAHDAQGRWFFQNGPQRVYVRLDAAPYVLHTDSTPATLLTHNALAVKHINGWWFDDVGRLFAQTEHGPGLVSGRDTPGVFEALYTSTGEPLLQVLEA